VFKSGTARVRTPASCANLGPGFDALGLALDLSDQVSARVSDQPGVRVVVRGVGSGELPTGPDHLVAQAMAGTFAALAAEPPGLEIECVNRIPQARGLGSSSSAIVAGVLLARALVAGGDQRLDAAGCLALAARLEGHPDNVAACLLGGLTIAWIEGGAARAVRLEPAAAVRPEIFIPDVRGLTAHARAALPPVVPHADAAHAAGRAALLIYALTQRPDLLLPATEDRLHQPYRAASMPDSAELVERLRDAGVAAVVSGAGPAVLAFPPAGWVPPELGENWRHAGLAWSRSGAIDALDWEHVEREPVAAGPES
jgi:homoserine kinase